ncbi:MAG TPA: hypothetical protein VHK27_15730, partial [Gammaproteobacteria bacterium]|nr:hypothetical protein [Gammaproteobacteria bacterium]
MLQFCGQQFTVYKVAHKLCDTITYSGMRRMSNSVHLAGVRCDGQAHGGCQTGCLVYWKEAWLKRVESAENDRLKPDDEPRSDDCDISLLHVATRKGAGADGEETFSCQATELLRAAPELLPLRNFGQYVQDVRSGNENLLSVIRTFLIGLFNRLQERSTRILPQRLWFRGGRRWGFLKGMATAKTPTAHTELQPGELVRIKSKEEILKTVNKDLLNRGLSFDQEMVSYCGREARVLRRVDRLIDEKTGKMVHLKNPCIVLEDVVCKGAHKASCPRAFYSFWREIWLERAEEGGK